MKQQNIKYGKKLKQWSDEAWLLAKKLKWRSIYHFTASLYRFITLSGQLWWDKRFQEWKVARRAVTATLHLFYTCSLILLYVFVICLVPFQWLAKSKLHIKVNSRIYPFQHVKGKKLSDLAPYFKNMCVCVRVLYIYTIHRGHRLLKI